MIEYEITLRPTATCPDAAAALRALLKLSLRRFKLRCVRVREASPNSRQPSAESGKCHKTVFT